MIDSTPIFDILENRLSVSETRRANGHPAEDICLACGLCCNGAIFADVRLQAGDEPARLLGLGLPLRISNRKGEPASNLAGEPSARVQRFRFSQPCAAFDGCRCRVYDDRPRYCRLFECGVLKSLKAGKISHRTALRLIRSARTKADHVRRLLRNLGDTEEDLPLAKRMGRTSRRLEEIGLERQAAQVYSKLTLAAHDLNFLLSEAFYPGHNIHEA